MDIGLNNYEAFSCSLLYIEEFTVDLQICGTGGHPNGIEM